jgi:hypothetical protein
LRNKKFLAFIFARECLFQRETAMSKIFMNGGFCSIGFSLWLFWPCKDKIPQAEAYATKS